MNLALENFNEVLELDKTYAPSYNGRGLVWDRFFNFEITKKAAAELQAKGWKP